MRAFDYVAVGHVTVDVLEDPADAPPDPSNAPPGPGGAGLGRPDVPPGSRDAPLDPGDARPDVALSADRARGARQPGGGAFYSALQAARLGLRTLVLTRGVPEELAELLAPYAGELTVRIEPAPCTTTLLTRGRGADRSQRVLAWAGPIEGPAELDTEILHLAPVARETPARWEGRAAFVALTPQGLVRAWDADGEIRAAEPVRDRVPSHCDALVFSAHERALCARLEALCGASLVAITAGAGATRILRAGAPPVEVEACGVPLVREDLGAGDVFAAAFFVGLHRGMEVAKAAAFGNAAAAVRIAGRGPRAVGDRDAIERRLGAHAEAEAGCGERRGV